LEENGPEVGPQLARASHREDDGHREVQDDLATYLSAKHLPPSVSMATRPWRGDDPPRSRSLALVALQLVVAALVPLLEMLRVVLALPTVERVFLQLFLLVATAVVVPPGEGKRSVLVKGGSAMPGGGVLRESRRRERGDQGEGEQRERLPHSALLLPRVNGGVNERTNTSS
jgi:hypothetical protein